jgi:hypothetical protein
MKGRGISNQLKASDPVIDMELPWCGAALEGLQICEFGSAKVWP